MAKKHKKEEGLVRRLFTSLGPGLITGAADDDPSGIATYSVAGAQFGTGLIWTALISLPLMAATQMMCARIGMVTGKGLADALNEKFPKWLIMIASAAVLIANVINIGADLSGMADAAAMLAHIDTRIYVVLFGIGIALVTVRFRYGDISNILKWLTLSLFAYIVTGFIVHPDWKSVLHDTFVPSLPKGHAGWAILVALLGTTISPYLFFWQTSMEVEEEKAQKRLKFVRMRGTTDWEITRRKFDVGAGAFASNSVMYFIILTTAYTLHAHGKTNIQTSREAAEALKPFAGGFATWIFACGLIGVGLLSIPTLAGSAAYACAGTFRWREGLGVKFKHAPAFYAVLVASIVIGCVLNLVGINPVRALVWSAVVNGLVAPFLMIGILVVACDPKIMKKQTSSLLGRIVVAITTLLMFGAGIGMFIF